jgi:hypothetical protein
MPTFKGRDLILSLPQVFLGLRQGRRGIRRTRESIRLTIPRARRAPIQGRHSRSAISKSKDDLVGSHAGSVREKGSSILLRRYGSGGASPMRGGEVLFPRSQEVQEVYPIACAACLAYR